MNEFGKVFDKVLSFFRILTLSLIVLTVVLGCVNEFLKKQTVTTDLNQQNMSSITLEVFARDEHPNKINV